MAKPRVYSYSRFSDPRQSTGHSAERQAEYAAKWAAEHGMELDETLTLRDEGLSAFHQHHITRGALGVFLRAVEDSMIPSGSYLVVEGLDRLSRAEPIQAQAQLASIISAGITVVTASDGKVYNRETLKAQPMDLVYSLLIMVRANEESETKSKRVTAAIRRQCDGWMSGKFRGVIRNGKDPRWVEWDGEKFNLIPKRVEAVRFALQLYQEGNGGSRIAREMEDRGYSFDDIGVQVQQIYRIVKLRALIGEKAISVGGEDYRLPGYYPPVLSENDFAKLQLHVDKRVVRKGKGEIPSLLTGIRGMTRCGYCGNVIFTSNSGALVNKKGHQIQAHRRIICNGYKLTSGCAHGLSSSVVPVENAVMDFCSDQMNLNSMVLGSDRSSPIMSRLNTLRGRMSETERQINKLTTIMLDDDGGSPKAFILKVRELEEKQAADKLALEKAELELSQIGSVKTPALAKSWQEAKTGAKSLDYDARMKIRRLVGETFAKVVIYLRGMNPTEDGGEMVDILLISKAGNTRALRIHRFTGEWQSMEDYKLPEVTLQVA